MTNMAELSEQIPGNERALDELFKLHVSGKAIAFVGAGASAGLYPLWSELVRQLISETVGRGLAAEEDQRFWLELAKTRPQQVALVGAGHQKVARSMVYMVDGANYKSEILVSVVKRLTKSDDRSSALHILEEIVKSARDTEGPEKIDTLISAALYYSAIGRREAAVRLLAEIASSANGASPEPGSRAAWASAAALSASGRNKTPWIEEREASQSKGTSSLMTDLQWQKVLLDEQTQSPAGIRLEKS